MGIKLDETARAAGYESYAQACEALKFGIKWRAKHPHVMPPIHIQRALDFHAHMLRVRDTARIESEQRAAKSARNPRLFFRVIPPHGFLHRFRRFVRRRLGLYLPTGDAVAHFSSLIPPVAKELFHTLQTTKSRGEVLAAFGAAADALYGISEQDKILCAEFARLALGEKDA